MKTTTTNFTIDRLETNKSDKTINISNSDFLAAIFGEINNNTYPIVISFSGNPTTVAKYFWCGKPWNIDSSTSMPDNANNYFSLACFKSNETGEYRRKKSHFQSLHAIMLDDIGAKVPIQRLSLSPSWLLETSAGNYQAGYILAEPITSSKTADQLMNALINAGLSDPGANGPTARLARLPVAINGKHVPAFSCQLRIWEPEKRYSPQDLIDGLQLEIIEHKSKQRNHQTHEPQEDDSDQIWSPRPEENTVIVALKNRALYKSPLGEGKHDITCPWVMEHTNSLDSGTAYFEPDDNYPIGGFKCQHVTAAIGIFVIF